MKCVHEDTELDLKPLLDELRKHPAHFSGAAHLISVVLASLFVFMGSSVFAQSAGLLDPTWSPAGVFGAGKTLTSFVGSGAGGALAVQSDGRVVVAGNCFINGRPAHCAIRYKTSGELDTSFGVAGIFRWQIGSQSSATSLAIQTDGKILLAGNCSPSDTEERFCVVRLENTGQIDSNFAINGVASIAIRNSTNRVTGIALRPDGRILLAGFCGFSIAYDFCLAQFETNGSLDLGFGSNGIVTTFAGNSSAGISLLLLPSGEALVGGRCDRRFCIAKYRQDGSLDLGYGANGLVQGDAGSLNAIALQPDGRLIAAGFCNKGGPLDGFCAFRYTARGEPDLSFGSGGRLNGNFTNGSDLANAIAVHRDGRFYLVGDCSFGLGYQMCVAAYSADGVLDSGFAGKGWAQIPVTGVFDYAVATKLLDGGKLLLAGGCFDSSMSGFCTARIFTKQTLAEQPVTALPPAWAAAFVLCAGFAGALVSRKTINRRSASEVVPLRSRRNASPHAL